MKHQQPGMPLWDCPETLDEARRIIEGQYWSRMGLIKDNQEMTKALMEIESIAKSALYSWKGEQ